MNVCRVKTAAFGFQEPSKGARSYNFWLQMKKSGNHTYCKVRVTDNGNERLPCQNCSVWLSGAIKGGAQLQLLAANEKKLKIIHIVRFGSLITEMNVGRVKTAAFGFQASSSGEGVEKLQL